MKVSVADLRYKMKNILKALDRNEKVTIMYHGKEKGTIIPAASDTDLSVSGHPFFGMKAGKTTKSVEEMMADIRGVRCSY